MSFLFVFLGGGLGAVLRYSLSLMANILNLSPWLGTMMANIVGCLLIFLGVKYRFFDSINNQLIYKVGLLGGLTTFSTYSLEVVSAFKSGDSREGFLILFLNIIFGIAIGIGILR